MRIANNGGQSWANATVGALGFSGPFYPALSDSGRTVGWVNYDSASSPARVRFQACTAATFGAWTTHLNSVGAEQFNTTWNSIVVGLPQGVAAIDNRQADANQAVPNAGEARTLARRRVADMGGNGVSFDKCAEFSDVPGCLKQVICYGQALKVAEEK